MKILKTIIKYGFIIFAFPLYFVYSIGKALFGSVKEEDRDQKTNKNKEDVDEYLARLRTKYADLEEKTEQLKKEAEILTENTSLEPEKRATPKKTQSPEQFEKKLRKDIEKHRAAIQENPDNLDTYKKLVLCLKKASSGNEYFVFLQQAMEKWPNERYFKTKHNGLVKELKMGNLTLLDGIEIINAYVELTDIVGHYVSAERSMDVYRLVSDKSIYPGDHNAVIDKLILNGMKSYKETSALEVFKQLDSTRQEELFRTIIQKERYLRRQYIPFLAVTSHELKERLIDFFFDAGIYWYSEFMEYILRDPTTLNKRLLLYLRNERSSFMLEDVLTIITDTYSFSKLKKVLDKECLREVQMYNMKKAGDVRSFATVLAEAFFADTQGFRRMTTEEQEFIISAGLETLQKLPNKEKGAIFLLLYPWKNDFSRSILETIDDEDILFLMCKHDYSRSRSEIIPRITSSQKLWDIYENDSEEACKLAAVIALNDREMLTRIARYEWNKYLAKQAEYKLQGFQPLTKEREKNIADMANDWGTSPVQLHSAEELFCYADYFNWDNELKHLLTLIKKKNCDKATALMIYWTNNPISYNDYESVPDDYHAEGWHLRKEIEKRYVAGKYVETSRGFNPQASDFDADKAHNVGKVPVPEIMFEPVEEKFCAELTEAHKIFDELKQKADDMNAEELATFSKEVAYPEVVRYIVSRISDYRLRRKTHFEHRQLREEFYYGRHSAEDEKYETENMDSPEIIRATTDEQREYVALHNPNPINRYNAVCGIKSKTLLTKILEQETDDAVRKAITQRLAGKEVITTGRKTEVIEDAELGCNYIRLSSHERKLFTERYNYNLGLKNIYAVLNSDVCDKALALQIYWDNFYDLRRSDEYMKESFYTLEKEDLLHYIQEKFLAGRFKESFENEFDFGAYADLSISANEKYDLSQVPDELKVSVAALEKPEKYDLSKCEIYNEDYRNYTSVKQTKEALHDYVTSANWDDTAAEKTLFWMAKNPMLDVGSAIQMFWHNCPEDYYASVVSPVVIAEKSYRKSYVLNEILVQNVERGFYETSEIKVDYSKPETIAFYGYNEDKSVRKIPDFMFKN